MRGWAAAGLTQAYSGRHLSPKAGKRCHVTPRPSTWPALEQPEALSAARSHRPPASPGRPPLSARVGRQVSKAATPRELSGGGPRTGNMREPRFLPSPHSFALHRKSRNFNPRQELRPLAGLALPPGAFPRLTMMAAGVLVEKPRGWSRSHAAGSYWGSCWSG